jgi:hypothetical protein
MDEPCQKASEIDLARFVVEPRDAQWEGFRQHYPTCATCTAALAAWTRLEQRLRATEGSTILRHPAAESLVTYQRQMNDVSSDQRQAIADHLRECPRCRDEIRALASFDMTRVRRWVTEAGVPNPEVATSLPAVVPGPAGASLSRVVLGLARRGLAVVEQALVEPLRGFSLEPVAAITRGTQAAADEHALTFRLEAAEMSVHVAAARRDDGLALTLTFRGAGQEMLTDTRVTIRQSGRTVLSAKTDGHGQVRMPHLDPGVYEVACREPQVAFQLEVREEPAATVITREPRS